MSHETSLLPTDWDVPAALRSRLGTTAGRQRVMEEEGHLLLVLHAPPSGDEAGRRGRFFWRDRQGQWRVAPKAERVTSLDDHLNEYHTLIERLEQAEEDAQSAREYFVLLDEVAPLTRATRNLYETMQAAREAARDDRRLIVTRDRAYELARRADLLYSDARNGLEFAIAQQGEAQAESSYQMSVAAHRLNVLVAFFFPIATLSAIFGANLQHGFESWDLAMAPLPLAAIISFGLLVGIALTAYVTRPAHRPDCNSGVPRAATPTRKQ